MTIIENKNFSGIDIDSLIYSNIEFRSCNFARITPFTNLPGINNCKLTRCNISNIILDPNNATVMCNNVQFEFKVIDGDLYYIEYGKSITDILIQEKVNDVSI